MNITFCIRFVSVLLKLLIIHVNHEICLEGHKVEYLFIVNCATLIKYGVNKNCILTGYGITTDGRTQFINASTCTLRYKPVNPPIVFDFPVPEGHSKDELLSIKPVRIIRNSIT